MSLSKEEVKKVAGLARLRMNDEEMERLAPQLSNIIGFIEQLSELDTDNVEPLANVVDITLPLREDVVSDGNCGEEILANSQDANQGYFVVPKVIE
ncbi:MAG: Asp-tRNA(Asn)/Glu-tRNA(Gln) amidotransferase subunit GatC [Alphaproteobacteria bacterium]|nr:Asp-tRNA(Asn)/Glu-tRNA(Gln) amidotransferase subunit GatC [Alphaproteobacteria bacterium]